MANQTQTLKKKQEYTMSQADRLALIGQTRLGKRALLIEQQRAEFVRRYGDPFGQTLAECNGPS